MATTVVRRCSVTAEAGESLLVIRINGEFDVTCEDDVVTGVLPLAVGYPASRVVVDCSEMSFIDSVGIQLLLRISLTAQVDGRMALRGLNPRTERILRFVKVDQVFDLHVS